MMTAPKVECRVLVIDDSVDIANLVQAYSNELPIEVHIAETAENGLQQLKENRFDIVLMDFHLPGINGAEALKQLRRWEYQWKMRATTVFALTDLHNVETAEKMLMAGCTALLGKPLARHQFLTLASRYRRNPASSAAKN